MRLKPALRVVLTLTLAMDISLPAAGASRCDLRLATTWHTTITAGNYKLLFDDDADLGAEPQQEHALHGDTFLTDTDSFRVMSPGGGFCLAAPNVGIVTTPVFIGNGRYLYIPTYSGSDAYLFVVDAKTCATVWQSADLDGMPQRTAVGYDLPGAGGIFIGPDCLPVVAAKGSGPH